MMDTTMSEPIRGLEFLTDHHDALDDWADYMASMGWRGEIEEFDEAVPGAFFVTLPGSGEPAFAVWRSVASEIVIADWRSADTIEAGETAHGSLDDALSAVVTSVTG